MEADSAGTFGVNVADPENIEEGRIDAEPGGRFSSPDIDSDGVMLASG